MKKTVLLFIGSAIAALAASANSVSDRLAECQQIDDASQKLACFEQVANDVSENEISEESNSASPDAVSLSAPPNSAILRNEPETVDAVAAREKPVARPKPAKTKGSDRYDATVKRADYSVTGKLIVELSNGEIWQQSSRGNFRLPPAGTDVRVRKSFSGAWFLKFDHDGRESRMKLKRYGG